MKIKSIGFLLLKIVIAFFVVLLIGIWCFFFLPWITLIQHDFETINHQNKNMKLEIETIPSNKNSGKLSLIEQGSPYVFRIFIETDYDCEIVIEKLKIFRSDQLVFSSKKSKNNKIENDSNSHFFSYNDIEIGQADYDLVLIYRLIINGKRTEKKHKFPLKSSYSKEKKSIASFWKEI